MACIKDYLRRGGDLSFCERPFGDVDNVVMAALSYVDLSDVVPPEGAGTTTVTRALGRVLAGVGSQIAPLMRSEVGLDGEFLHLVAASPRFGRVLLRDYVDVLDCARTLQFSAVTADVSDDLTVVTYRGTDHSLAGWRENFMLGFRITPAQELARAYLTRAVAHAAREGRRVVVCGHSKGGNLATYASMACPAELRAHIACVWSNDGPGMAPEVMPASARETLGERYLHIVPRHSVVGMLFADARDSDKVVSSSASGVLQHDPTTWEVDGKGALMGATLAPESALVASTFSNWLDGIDLATRETFTNELFDALAAGDPWRMDAVLATPAAVRRVILAALATSPDTKGVARKLVSATGGTLVGAAGAWVRRMRRHASAAVRETAAEICGALRELLAS